MPLDALGWDRPLQHRRGGPTRLDGLDLYYDFEWLSVFEHQQAMFKNGQCLAQRVRSYCPEGKTPALLLTTNEDAEEGFVETDSDYVLVVNVTRYRNFDADAALSYWADGLGANITRVTQLNDLADADPDALRAFIERNLDIEHIAVWLQNNHERMSELRALPGFNQADVAAVGSGSDVIAAIDSLDELDPSVITEIARLVGAGADRETRRNLLQALTDDADGRYITGRALHQRTTERLADARETAARYVDLLEAPATTETDLQGFIEENLWLLGLDYAHMRPRHQIPRGTADFILERFDGFHDLLELKSPQDPIIAAPDAGERPPSASAYSLSTALAQALAQVHVYRSTLNMHADTTRELYGLPHARDPRVIVVIGKLEEMTDHRQQVLREINKSLHRVEIVPYDLLAKRANAVLDNVETYLVADDVPALNLDIVS